MELDFDSDSVGGDVERELYSAARPDLVSYRSFPDTHASGIDRWCGANGSQLHGRYYWCYWCPVCFVVDDGVGRKWKERRNSWKGNGIGFYS